MQPIQEPIQGKKIISSKKEDILKYQALNQFYKAFNEANLDLMRKNWLNNDTIAMDNPLGGIKRGWGEIEEVYRRIFKGGVTVYVEFYDFTILNFEGGFCAVGRERGFVKKNGVKLDLQIRTSRVFSLVNGEYKQVHHHGSIENPTLLNDYQNLVK